MHASPAEFAAVLNTLRTDALLRGIFGVVGKSGYATSYQVAKELGRPLDRAEMTSLNDKLQSLQEKNLAVISTDPIDSMNRYISLTPRGIELYRYFQKEG